MSKTIAYLCPPVRLGGLRNSKEYQASYVTDVDALAMLSPVGAPNGAEKIEAVTDFFDGSEMVRSTLASVPLIPAVKVCAKGWPAPQPVVQSVIC
jgi:hypothetical protein